MKDRTDAGTRRRGETAQKCRASDIPVSPLDAGHGSGRLLVRQRIPGDGVLKTMVGYSWAGGAQSVSLIYFAAQDERNFFRLISLHYSARPVKRGSDL